MSFSSDIHHDAVLERREVVPLRGQHVLDAPAQVDRHREHRPEAPVETDLVPLLVEVDLRIPKQNGRNCFFFAKLFSYAENCRTSIPLFLSDMSSMIS